MRMYETVAGSMFTFTQLCKLAKRRNYVYVVLQPALEMLYKFLLIVTINIVESSQW